MYKATTSSPIVLVHSIILVKVFVHHRPHGNSTWSPIFPLQVKQAGRENLTERKNPHELVYDVKEFVCLSVCLSICYKLWPQLSWEWQNRIGWNCFKDIFSKMNVLKFFYLFYSGQQGWGRQPKQKQGWVKWRSHVPLPLVPTQGAIPEKGRKKRKKKKFNSIQTC